jgi:hypothetical protein
MKTEILWCVHGGLGQEAQHERVRTNMANQMHIKVFKPIKFQVMEATIHQQCGTPL